ncbi:MAG: outer membrane beta-barrel protein [Alphaproteobacteria bacterium]|nr:outer membrane beta-barrel protein [Alphaproteobacteria bacterium]
MKKNALLLTTILLSGFVFSKAQAGMYVGAGLGIAGNSGEAAEVATSQDYDYKSSPAYSLSLGYDVPILPIRVEGEFIRNSAKLKEIGNKVFLNGLMANAYVNLPFPIVSPYIGAGVGFVRFKGENTSAYQAMLGVEASIPFVPVKGGVEYRYLTTKNDSKFSSDQYNLDYDAHILMAKVRFEF